MGEEIKKFTNDYKKCTAKTKDCTLGAVTKLSVLIKNRHSTAGTGFSQLSDEVAVAQSKGITGTKIEDYAGEKNVLDVIKGIKKNQTEQLNFCNDLDDMARRAGASVPCLDKLAANIAKDLKSRAKKSKSQPDILKLEKLIQNDLSEIKKILAKAKTIPPIYRSPDKEYAQEVKAIASAKPKDLVKSKYATMAPRKMDTRILKKYLTICVKALRAIEKNCPLALDEAKKGDKSAMKANLKSCKVDLKKIMEIEKEYTVIQKEFQRDIDVSKDKKEIKDTIAAFVKIKKMAANLVIKTTEDIKSARA